MKRHIQQTLSLMMTLILLCALMPAHAAEEHYAWDCPDCGRAGNKGNFCGGCGHPAPWKETPPPATPMPDPTATPERLRITSQTSNVFVDSGKTVQLRAYVNQKNASYNWQYSLDPKGYLWYDVDSENYNGNKTSTLTFEASEKYEDRSYRCVITCGWQTVATKAVKVTITNKSTPTPKRITIATPKPTATPKKSSSPSITIKYDKTNGKSSLLVNDKAVSWNTKHDDVIKTFGNLGLTVERRNDGSFSEEGFARPYYFTPANGIANVNLDLKSKTDLSKKFPRIMEISQLYIETSDIDFEKKTIAYGKVNQMSFIFGSTGSEESNRKDCSEVFKFLYEEMVALAGKPKDRWVSAYPNNSAIPIDDAISKTLKKVESGESAYVQYGFGKRKDSITFQISWVLGTDYSWVHINLYP